MPQSTYLPRSSAYLNLYEISQSLTITTIEVGRTEWCFGAKPDVGLSVVGETSPLHQLL